MSRRQMIKEGVSAFGGWLKSFVKGEAHEARTATHAASEARHAETAAHAAKAKAPLSNDDQLIKHMNERHAAAAAKKGESPKAEGLVDRHGNPLSSKSSVHTDAPAKHGSGERPATPAAAPYAAMPTTALGAVIQAMPKGLIKPVIIGGLAYSAIVDNIFTPGQDPLWWSARKMWLQSFPSDGGKAVPTLQGETAIDAAKAERKLAEGNLTASENDKNDKIASNAPPIAVNYGREDAGPSQPSEMSSAFKNSSQFKDYLSTNNDALIGLDTRQMSQITTIWKDVAADGRLETKDRPVFEKKLKEISGLDASQMSIITETAFSPAPSP